MFCKEQCKCGSTRKPCKNKVSKIRFVDTHEKPPTEDDSVTINRVVFRESKLHSLQVKCSSLMQKINAYLIGICIDTIQ